MMTVTLGIAKRTIVAVQIRRHRTTVIGTAVDERPSCVGPVLANGVPYSFRPVLPQQFTLCRFSFGGKWYTLFWPLFGGLRMRLLR